MAKIALESILRRDRYIILGALGIVTVLTWAYLLWLAGGMSMAGMDMPMAMPAMNTDCDMSALLMPTLKPWTVADFAFIFIMWAVMMVGMMMPSAAPMILIYARVGRQAASEGKIFTATGWFASGYLLAWIGFAIVAVSAQWALERTVLLTPMMTGVSGIFGGIVLIAAGLYQWTPLKDACLSQCQSPLLFIQRHGGFQRDAMGALRLGIWHGAYCIGCCWALMTLLFVGGVMNLLWITALTILVLMEKAVPAGRLISRIAGIGLFVAGAWLLVVALR